MIKPLQQWKIRTKLLFLILIMAALCILLFTFLWKMQPQVYSVFKKADMFTIDQKDFMKEFRSKALRYNVPNSEEDEKGQKEIQSLLNIGDFFTSINIYGVDDGLYRCGSHPEVFDEFIYGSFLSMAQEAFLPESTRAIIEFKNGSYDVFVTFYHNSQFVYPYLGCSLIICIFVFLISIIVFINRIMRRIYGIKDSVLLMASGNLTQPLKPCGKDEIGILATEVDHLRTTLDSHIRREQQSRQANQDLITAISHDLRTPLTILNGYLEILKLKNHPYRQDEYLTRCLQKTEDIKEMTDKMFEYALVFEENESIHPVPLSLSFLHQCLRENSDFIRILGFPTDICLQENRGTFMGDQAILKRILQNLFSNILKYGSKEAPVQISCRTESGMFVITLSNTVKSDTAGIESNQIGLKSAEKMIESLHGSLYHFQEQDVFTVQLTIPLMVR